MAIIFFERFENKSNDITDNCVKNECCVNNQQLNCEEMLDLRKKLFEAEAMRLNGTETFSLDEVNECLSELCSDI